MPRKPKSRVVGGGRPIPRPTQLPSDYSTWIVDYAERCAAKNALTKSRKKETTSETTSEAV